MAGQRGDGCLTLKDLNRRRRMRRRQLRMARTGGKQWKLATQTVGACWSQETLTKIRVSYCRTVFQTGWIMWICQTPDQLFSLDLAAFSHRTREANFPAELLPDADVQDQQNVNV